MRRVAEARLNGVGMITVERQRQVEEEGFDAAHDAEHDGGELAMAAACYAAPVPIFAMSRTESQNVLFENPWPWDVGWDKRRANAGGVVRIPVGRKARIKMLAKAGALVAAEIDRLLNAGAD